MKQYIIKLTEDEYKALKEIIPKEYSFTVFKKAYSAKFEKIEITEYFPFPLIDPRETIYSIVENEVSNICAEIGNLKKIE